MVHRPNWFVDDKVLIVNAPTCGLNKDGQEQYVVDSFTGKRTSEIDDKLLEYTELVISGGMGGISHEHVTYIETSKINENGIIVPCYYDKQNEKDFDKEIAAKSGFNVSTLDDLVRKGFLEVSNGHGSPSQDQRVGDIPYIDIPYIKVSDLRAGSVNINPTNLIPRSLAEEFWRGKTSGLQAYDLISPERASKNIGEFCVLMPGQEDVVLTKEVIIIRATPKANFDQFYLMWALSLSGVRRQWSRIVFMQTNREDVGKRLFEIKIPVPDDENVSRIYAKPFRGYYEGLERLRHGFRAKLTSSGFAHHIFYT